MTQGQINKAYEALTHLAGIKLPVKTAYDVYKLNKQLSGQYEFAAQQEKQLIDKYHGELQPTGEVKFTSVADRQACQKELIDLNNFNPELEIVPVTIKMSDIGTGTITPMDMMALEGFVTFEE